MIAFSCKQQGFCPSFSAKRGAHWAEFVREQMIAAGTNTLRIHAEALSSRGLFPQPNIYTTTIHRVFKPLV